MNPPLRPPMPRPFDPESTLRTIDQLLRPIAAEPQTAAARQRLHDLVGAMATDGNERNDPMREIFARLGDRWSMLLIHLLRTGNFRHAMLRRLVSAVAAEGRISQRMLTLRLRTLEHDGFIMRQVTSTHPPGVEYGLTPLGHELATQIEVLMGWIRARSGEINAARSRFEAAAASSAGDLGDPELGPGP